ncbi:UNVERIFIED_CONTAM: Sodium transporter HKT1 [Sesamum latifolium]|uniref:Sodium transporter HKT1 n=1 Tax=Sesamum latifolium TaxID=2727402 RepID=A0AAW2VGC1_9LAMI
MFFTSVSAATVSSMSTVEMEVFSNAQLIVMTVLMFVGGEVFTSMVGLHLKRSKIIRTWKSEVKVESVESDPRSPPPIDPPDQIELNIVTVPERGLARANDVLRNKGIKTFTFAIFTIVSTFASCGFVPTNENMMVFGKNSGLLWILIPQVLFGNTLFPSCLRFLIWVVGKKIKKVEANYLLNHTTEAGYMHLLPSLHSVLLVATVFGFILLGFIIFCSLEWNSAALSGLNTYQKIVGILFQCVNARHSGETIVDLSTIAPAILVFFVVMMYLPPYTSFLPIKRDEQSQLESEGKKKRRQTFADNLIFSQLSYLVIFIILICITERKSMKEDPINFSVLNIIVEVISAYGNVGFTTGYSCERQLRPDPNCVNKWYGFSGNWSDEGKVILIIVMFFGRLKKFNMNGGRAWKLL